MKLSEQFPSKWLKGDDLGDGQPVVTIEDVTLEEFDNNKTGKKDRKVALHFLGKDKGMICNVGMRNILAGFFGDDTDAWHGKRIKIMAVPFTNDKGETSMVCRIHPKQPTPVTQPKPVPQQAEPVRVVQPPVEDTIPMDDDDGGGVPF